MIVEIFLTLLYAVPTGILGIFLVGKLVHWVIRRMASSPRLHHQFHVLMKDEKNEP